jgi:polar amino acid transport system substrate-binding protein
MRKLLGYVAVTLLLVAGGASALLYIRSGDDAAAPIWSGGEIRVGYSSEPPYSFRTVDGTVTGEAPAIAKAVLARIGVKRIRWVLLDFGKAIPALLDGQIDMIANGLFITPERAAVILFSLPYARTRPGLLVHLGNPLKLTSYELVAASPDVTAVVLDGSVEQRTLVHLGMPATRLFVVPDPSGGLAAVRSGRADCLALSAPTVSWLASESSSDVESAQPFHEPPGAPASQSAFGFRRTDTKLTAAVNEALREYIGTSNHLETVTPFGFGLEALPEWSR